MIEIVYGMQCHCLPQLLNLLVYLLNTFLHRSTSFKECFENKFGQIRSILAANATLWN